jgi:hypothetical protein
MLFAYFRKIFNLFVADIYHTSIVIKSTLKKEFSNKIKYERVEVQIWRKCEHRMPNELNRPQKLSKSGAKLGITNKTLKLVYIIFRNI